MSIRILALCLLSATTAVAQDPAPDPLATARDHLQHGRYEEAAEAADQIAAQPDLPPATSIDLAVLHSRIHEATGDWAAATEALRLAAQSADATPRLWARLAEVEFQQGRIDEATAAVTAALALDKDHPHAHLMRGHLARETGRFDDAIADYQWCVRYYNRRQPKDAETLLVLAEGALEYARWKRVSNIFGFVVNTLCPDALRADAAAWEAHLLTGQLLLEKFNREQAKPELDAALAINPQAAPVLAALAHAALQDSDFPKADDFADRGLAINPHLPQALLVKADVRLQERDAAGARPFVSKALAVNPRSQAARAREAVCCLIEDGSPADAELEAVFLHMDDIDKLELAEPSRFAQIVIEVCRTSPRPGEFLAWIGEALDAGRQFDLAELFFHQAINVMPQLAAPRTSLGMLAMRTGQLDEARSILDDAFRADPFHVRVSNMRKVLDVLEAYETISTDHFVIRVDASQKLLGRAIADYLERIYPELTERYGYEPPVRTQFEVYGAAKGQGAHEWFSARMIGLPWIQTIGASTGMVVAMASPVDMEPFNWARVVRHEFTHILTLQGTNFAIPHWFTEALAVGEEGLEFPDDWQQLLLARLDAGDVYSLTDINSGFQRPRDGNDWTLAYCQSHLYAKYMAEKFGDDATSQLLEAYKRGLDTPAAIEQTFGVAPDEFEAGYTKFLNDLAATLKPRRSPPPPDLEASRVAHEANPEDPDAAGRYALALLADEKLRSSGELAKQVNDAHPTQPDAAYVRARFALARDDEDRATELLTAALDEANPHASLLSQLARLKLDDEDYPEAARLYRIGYDRWPEEDRFLTGLAIALWREGDSAAMRPVLEVAARRQYDNVDIRIKLAEIALADKRYDDAQRWAEETLQIDVVNVAARVLLTRALLAKGDADRAARELEVVKELDPANAAIEELK